MIGETRVGKKERKGDWCGGGDPAYADTTEATKGVCPCTERPPSTREEKQKGRGGYPR